MKDKILTLKKQFSKEINNINNSTTLKDIEKIKNSYIGKNGYITNLYKELKNLHSSEKGEVGKIINEFKKELDKSFLIKQKEVKKTILENIKSQKCIDDITLPINLSPSIGGGHILNIIKRQISDFFISLGFDVFKDKEIETQYYNFESINIPKEHPARDMQDTFFLNNDLVLRTHTSAFQMKVLKSAKDKNLPIKVINIGKVFRKDEDDATHSHEFNQLDFMYVDKDINLSHLKGFLKLFINFFFEEEKEIRYRPSYFPFTEPSVEIDIKCNICNGKGCNICKNTGYIEILGAGLMHPNILNQTGFNSDEYTGLAFGVGIERIAMIKYFIDDIRYFYKNDIKFLKQFN